MLYQCVSFLNNRFSEEFKDNFSKRINVKIVQFSIQINKIVEMELSVITV